MNIGELKRILARFDDQIEVAIESSGGEYSPEHVEWIRAENANTLAVDRTPGKPPIIVLHAFSDPENAVAHTKENG